MVMESFSTVPLASTIKSYLYQEYAQDNDLQAFVDAYNAIAQGYQDWFNANPPRPSTRRCWVRWRSR